MAPRPDDIELSARFSLDWKAAELVDATFQGGVKAVLATLEAALEQARRNVAPGNGPGPHPHRTKHGFTWEDTGKLQDAIAIDPSFRQLPSGKYVGQAAGRLVVNPIEVPLTRISTHEAPDAGGTRMVNYGAYLELGFTPLIHTNAGLISGNWTRYPFLSPAMYMATEGFTQRAAVTLRAELADMEAKQKKRKAIFEKEAIDFSTLRRINRQGVLEDTVQPIRDLSYDDSEL